MENGYGEGRIFDLAYPAYIYQTIMLTMLYFLHLYWFGEMMTLFAKYIGESIKKGRMEVNKAYGNEWDYKVYNPE